MTEANEGRVTTGQALGLAFLAFAVVVGALVVGYAASRSDPVGTPADSTADATSGSAAEADTADPADSTGPNPADSTSGPARDPHDGTGGLAEAGGADDAGPAARVPATNGPDNRAYDGRFTFVRIQFDTGTRGSRFGFGREPPWAHDYPRAERHLMKILEETTYLTPYMDGGNIFTLDDPELFRYPLAYVSEPGYWRPTVEEAEAFRAYLLKGGFAIFDDFRGGDWYNFETQIRRVLPEALLEPMDVAHPIFHSFFEIESLDIAPPTFRQYRPVYYGVFLLHEDGRDLVGIANYNNDIGEYWEYSDTGFLPIALSNEAYKLGVNYIVYAMTH